MTIPAIALLGIVVCWLLIDPPRWLIRLVSRMAPRVLFSVPTDRPRVALTIDDGPSPELTGAILDILRKHGAHATFFVLGERAARHPELIVRIREEGHEIGNHMMADRRALLLGMDAFRREVTEAARVLGPDASRLFRAGSGWMRPAQRRLVEELGYRACLGSVYPHDVVHRSGRVTRWFMLRKVRPGDIVILHEGDERRRGVLRALDEALPEMSRRGLEVASVGKLVATGRRVGRRS